MTSNQINYHKLLEDRRHNRVTEAEAKRAAQANERIKERANLIQEAYNLQIMTHNANVLSETKRHNLAQEDKDLVYMNLVTSETQRHNVASEAIQNRQIDLGYANLNESIRQHNVLAAETQRHNMAQESLAITSEANRHYANLASIAETQRSNVQNQLLNYQKAEETKRHNVAMEIEAHRANVASEQISSRNTDIRGVDVVSTQINQWYKTLVKGRRR